ncbi:hypothetical protein [Dyadobacter luteus]|nr:hypothetical protein [Dyadobacter luteus]
MNENLDGQENRDGLPPFVRNWPQLYMVLIGTLIFLIVFFYWFMIGYQ